ncbi:MAG: hypothetical protein Q3972_05310 [Corynebacterium sp.]|nr:hypothetical protein [Corynebacterium sp.]
MIDDEIYLNQLTHFLERRGLKYTQEGNWIVIRWEGAMIRLGFIESGGPQLQAEMYFGACDVPSLEFLHKVNEWNATFVHPVARMIPMHAELSNCLSLRDFYYLQAGASQEQLDLYLPYFLDTMVTVREFFADYITVCPNLDEAKWQDSLIPPNSAWRVFSGQNVPVAVAMATSEDEPFNPADKEEMVQVAISEEAAEITPAGMAMEHYVERGPTFMTRATFPIERETVDAIMAANEWNKKAKVARVFYDEDNGQLHSEVVCFTGGGVNTAQMEVVLDQSADYAIYGLVVTLRALGYETYFPVSAYDEFLLPD